MDAASRITNIMARSPTLAGVTLGTVGAAVFGIEQTHLAGHSAAQAATDSTHIAVHVGLIGILGFSGWLLGRLVRQKRSHENLTQKGSALQESQELSRALLDDGSAEIITVDLDGRITGFNNAVRNSGRQLPVIGDRLFAGDAGRLEVSAGDFRGPLGDAVRHCISTRTTRNFADIAHADARWNVNISPFSGGAIISSVDITEQKKRENIRRALYDILDATTRSQTLDELLVSIHEQVKTVMRAHNFFVAMYDASCDRYSFLYRADEHDSFPLNTPLDIRGGLTDLVRVTGKPKLESREDVETLIGEESVRLLGRRSESWLGVPFPSGSDVGVVVVQTYTPGSPYTLSDQDALQAISGQIGLAIERKRSGEEIAKRKQLLERILDNSTMGFAINNTVTGEVLYVNDAFPRTYRISREACGDAGTFIQTVYGERAELGRRILADIASNDPARMVWEDIELTDTNGDTFHISARNITLPEQELIISTVLDVTAQTRMREQQAVLENRLQLTQKMESVGVLAGGIAHDFNNLLTAILGNLDLARSEANPEERAALLDQASNACIDATHLTRQLLTFASGGEPVRKVVYIRRLIMDTVGFALSGSNVKADFRLDDTLSAVEVDEGQLKQVIHNLVLNAKQAMPDGGRVEVHATNATRRDPSTGAVDRIVRISVRDSGTGISAANLPRIFEPYFTTKQKGSGTGLGLATAYSIIRRHSGTLSVESALGEGTVFFIELPASVKPVVRADTQFVAGVDGGGRRILVMDDEEAIRRLAEKMLLRHGYRPELVSDGAAALQAYEAAIRDHQPFAVVILDLTIPGGMGGRETFAGLKAIHPGVKAIVSSGYSDANESSEYREQGFAASLQKPYNRDDLVRTMARVLSLD
jgi:signal transduction histidine kinase/CheY-like chemotaxis protein